MSPRNNSRYVGVFCRLVLCLTYTVYVLVCYVARMLLRPKRTIYKSLIVILDKACKEGKRGGGKSADTKGRLTTITAWFCTDPVTDNATGTWNFIFWNVASVARILFFCIITWLFEHWTKKTKKTENTFLTKLCFGKHYHPLPPNLPNVQ